MAINLQQVNDSPLTIRLVSTLGHALPLDMGHSLADFLAGRLANQRNTKMIQAIRANQWVVRGETQEKETLDKAVVETMRSSARSIFDLYHYIQNSEATQQLIVMDQTTSELVKRAKFDRRGLMVVGLHLSSFDLVLHWLFTKGLQPMVLTIPDPQGGRRVEYERRKKTGMNYVPGSVGAIRQAIRYLEQGGIVMTGIDRPVPGPKLRPRFFGRPAALPTHHIYLALKTHSPIMVIFTNWQADGKYHVITSDLIEMDAHANKEVEILENAEKVLGVAEKFIRQAPEQWTISLPVWPDISDLVP